MGMKFMEMIKFLESLIINSTEEAVTPEDVQESIDLHGYGREALYRQLKHRLMRKLDEKGEPALSDSFIERECHKWVYNRAI